MDDSLFIGADALSALVGFVGDYVALGIGLAICFWVFGFVLAFVRDFMMGGV